MTVIKETLKFGSILAGLAMLALAIGPAHAGSSCSDKSVNAFGDIGGGPFNVPADTRSLTGPSDEFVALSAEDCSNHDEARRDGRRAASIAASMDTFGVQPGLNLTINGANTGLGNDDTYAAGGVVSYRHDFANPGTIHAITGKAGFAADTTGSDYGATVGLTLSFGTF